MGTISASFFITLDGVIESPDQWQGDYENEQGGEAITKRTDASEAFLMGRVVYDLWVTYWPNQGDDEPFAEFINRVPKYVVSNTLTDPTWSGTNVLSGDVDAQLDAVRALKDRTPGNIMLFGSAATTRLLLANGLLDELHLMLHPIVLGRGQRLFEESATYPMRLVEQETFDTGVLNLVYAPAG